MSPSIRSAPVPNARLAFLLSALVLVAGCGQSQRHGEAPDSTAAHRGSVVAPPPPPPPDTAVHQPRYRAVKIRTAWALRRLRKELGADRFLLVLKVNRRDSSHVRDGDSLMVPVDTTLGLLALSPFPHEVPAAKEQPKL